MKRRDLVKKGLALVLTVAMCAQPLIVSAEEFAFQSEMEDTAVTETASEQIEKGEEAEDFQSEDLQDEVDGMIGTTENKADEVEVNETETKEISETDDFVASFDESGNGLDIDESAETVIKGVISNAEGLTWRLDVNGVLYLEGTGKLPDESLYYEAKDNKGKFSDYSVTALVIGDGISGELYDGAYICSSKNLQNVVIGKGISSIWGDAFQKCTVLEKVVIPGNVESIGDYAFYGCTSLKTIVLSNGIKRIGMGAFVNISPEAELFIPNSVTSIWPDEWPDCKKITMPCRLALKDGLYALYRQPNISLYHMNGENDWDEDNCTVCRRTGKCGTDSTYIMTISGKATVSGTGTVSVLGGDMVEDMTSLIVEDGIYYIDASGIYEKLESIEIADSVKKINGFWDCYNLKTVTIGKGLEKDFRFSNCPKLESVIISNENPNYTSKDGVIYSKDGTRLVYYPENLQGEEFVIPDGVREISPNAFCYNQNLRKIVIPETVQTLDSDNGCYVEFYNCKSLETIVLNNTVNNIPSDFCRGSELFREITIPKGAKYIGSEAFKYCKNLKTITLPASLKEIGSGAFDGCSSLTTVHYLGTDVQWKEIEISEKNEFLTDANIHYCTLVQDNTTTCDYAGNRVYNCAACGITFTVNVPKTEHNYSDWEVTRKATCSQEGELTSVCSKCGDMKHRAIEKEHHNFKWSAGVAATCEKDGLSQESKCINCGYVDTAAKVIPAMGHSYYTVSQTFTSCTENGKEVDCCFRCGKEITRELPAKGHQYNTSVFYAATVLAPAYVVKKCSVCGHEEKNETGSKLPATISVNTTSITLKVKQATTKVQVYNLTPGDAIKSWISSNTKIVKVTDSGKIIAQNKTGTANVTVTLLSGKTATIKVKVQKGAVKTTKISGLKNTTLKVKKKLTLTPVISPITSVQKVTFISSNKKVATVSKNGVVTAKKKGKTVITVKSGSKKISVKITVK